MNARSAWGLIVAASLLTVMWGGCFGTAPPEPPGDGTDATDTGEAEDSFKTTFNATFNGTFDVFGIGVQLTNETRIDVVGEGYSKTPYGSHSSWGIFGAYSEEEGLALHSAFGVFGGDASRVYVSTDTPWGRRTIDMDLRGVSYTTGGITANITLPKGNWTIFHARPGDYDSSMDMTYWFEPAARVAGAYHGPLGFSHENRQWEGGTTAATSAAAVYVGLSCDLSLTDRSFWHLFIANGGYFDVSLFEPDGTERSLWSTGGDDLYEGDQELPFLNQAYDGDWSLRVNHGAGGYLVAEIFLKGFHLPDPFAGETGYQEGPEYGTGCAE